MGAAFRYGLSQSVVRWMTPVFPWGTWVVNMSGCLFIGIVTSKAHVTNPRVFLLIDVGIIGAYTTFSSFSYETLRLMESGDWPRAIANPVLSLAMGLIAVWLGIRVGALL